MSKLRPVILSGGAGTRLWPISTASRPKQFVDLFDGQTLFGLTLSRLLSIPAAEAPLVVTGERFARLVRDEIGPSVDARLLLEPGGRNTAPAIFAAALSSAPEDVLVICPADHLIENTDAFRLAVVEAADLAQRGMIVTFGIEPDYPATGYGYIRAGDPVGAGFGIAEFVEKPELNMAAEYLESGGYTWNSGMFVAKAAVIVEAAEAHSANVLTTVSAAVAAMNGETLGSDFLDAEAISFDNAVMERTDRGVVIPLDAGWSDLGSYQALLAALPKDENGNYRKGEVALIDCKNCFVSSDSLPISLAGLEDMVVVVSSGVVLAVPISEAQSVKNLVELDTRS